MRARTGYTLLIFLGWILLSGFTMLNHELWGDEFHSWNIVKASQGYPEMLSNIRYEGHPPVWYSLLWVLSKFTHNPGAIQVLHWLIALAVIYLVVFVSPFPLWIKALLPFGYYFIFEYAVLSRNYAIGVLLALLVCLYLHRKTRVRWLFYYSLLFLLSNTHLLAVLLAASLHLYCILLVQQEKKPFRQQAFHVIFGILVCIPSLYFIFPPSDSGLDLSFWIGQWDRDHIGIIAKTPLRVFMPVPALERPDLWNSQVLLEAQQSFGFLRPVTLFLSAAFLFLAVYILKDNRKALLVFVANLLFTFVIAALFPLTTSRYIGFIFTGFAAALWLFYEENRLTRLQVWFLSGILALQVIAGLIFCYRDLRDPFSHAQKVKQLQLPAGVKPVTDYWAVNALSAFNDDKYYTVGLDREVSFLKWNDELKMKLRHPYTSGFGKLFDSLKQKTFYLVSMYSPAQVNQADSSFLKMYLVSEIKSYTGAIERWSNLYLYEVSRGGSR